MGMSKKQGRCLESRAHCGSCSSSRWPHEGTRGRLVKAVAATSLGIRRVPGTCWSGYQVAPRCGTNLPWQQANRNEGGTQEPQDAGGTGEGL